LVPGWARPRRRLCRGAGAQLAADRAATPPRLGSAEREHVAFHVISTTLGADEPGGGLRREPTKQGSGRAAAARRRVVVEITWNRSWCPAGLGGADGTRHDRGGDGASVFSASISDRSCP
jgi:hypothetical protein